MIYPLVKAEWEIGPYSPCPYQCDGYSRNIDLTCIGTCTESPPPLYTSCMIEERLYDFELGDNITQFQAATTITLCWKRSG